MNVDARFKPKNFLILSYNFGKQAHMLTEGKFVEHAEPDPKSMTESNFWLSETLGLFE